MGSTSNIVTENGQTFSEIVYKVLTRSCNAEESEPIEGVVTGEIPKWLNGKFLRNGPGMAEVGSDQYSNYYDSLALLHCFDIKNGKSTYKSKFLRSETFKKNTKANKIVVSEFGTAASPDPNTSIFKKIQATLMPDFTDNNNMNIVKLGNDYYAASVTERLHKIDVESLETVKRISMSDYISVRSLSPHPHKDKDGTTYNVGSSYDGLPAYTIIKIPPIPKGSLKDPFSNASVICRIPCTHSVYPSYGHSFAMTENYFIIVEQSLVINIPKLLWRMAKGLALAETLEFDPKLKTRILVIDRNRNKALSAKFLADPFVVVNHSNAYEEDGHLIVDLSAFKNADFRTAMEREYLQKVHESKEDVLSQTVTCQNRRYILPLQNTKNRSKNCKENLVTLANGKATATPQSDGSIFCVPEVLTPGLDCFEVTKMNYEKYSGRKYRYLYGLGRETNSAQSGLIKLMVQETKHIIWSLPGWYPTEPLFVESPDSQSEDDGIVMSAFANIDDQRRIALVILDARTLVELARVEFVTKSPITVTFHGIFVPNENVLKN